MTTEDFDSRLAKWLESDAAGRVSHHLEPVLAATVRTPQRREIRVPIGSGVRLGAVRPFAIAAAGLLLAALAAAGLGTRPLTPTPVPTFVPATDGDLVIKTTKDGDLFRADATGSNRQLLAVAAIPEAAAGGDHIHDVKFSPDGSRVAFREIVDDAEEYVFVANADGSNRRRVFNLPIKPLDFAWSPDGRRLAMVHPTVGDADISLVPVDAPQAVTSVAVPEGAQFLPYAFGFQVAWRGPGDGELLLTGSLGPVPKAPGVFAIRPDGSGFRDVGRFDFEYVALSRDGRWLTYFNYQRDAGRVVGATTHLVDLATGADRVISSGRSGLDQELAFSPDGTTGVMVACSDFGDCKLVVVALDGSALPREIGTIGGPTPKERSLLFSPDSRSIVVQDAGETPVIIDIESGAVVSLEGVYSVEAWQSIPATR
jgi:dipeptidyl aminopeptidase/acylaminoacyl peptidase